MIIGTGIVGLLVTLVVLGLIFYCIQLIPMAEPFPAVIRVIAIIVAVLLVLQSFGLIPASGLIVR